MMFPQNTTYQEAMDAWLPQLQGGEHPLLESGVLSLIRPKVVSYDTTKKEVTCSFIVEDWQLDASGNIHTGIITTAFDTVFGLLCHCFAKGQRICTVNLTASFLQSMPADASILYRVYVLSSGKTLVTLRGEAYCADKPDVVYATADTTFMILNRTH